MKVRKSVKTKINKIAKTYERKQDLAGQLPKLRDDTLEYANAYGKFLKTTINYHDLLDEFNQTELRDGEKKYFEEKMNTIVDKIYLEEQMNKAVEKTKAK